MIEHELSNIVANNAEAEPERDNDDESQAGDGGEPDTPPDCEEVVEVDPDDADALVDAGIGAA